MSETLDKFLAEYDRRVQLIEDTNAKGSTDGFTARSVISFRAQLREFVDTERDGLLIEMARIVAKLDNLLSSDDLSKASDAMAQLGAKKV